jgi:hypothetical protein
MHLRERHALADSNLADTARLRAAFARRLGPTSNPAPEASDAPSS